MRYGVLCLQLEAAVFQVPAVDIESEALNLLALTIQPTR